MDLGQARYGELGRPGDRDRGENPKGAEARIRELEEFFESAWFCKLTDMEGELILERLRKEAVE